MGKLGGRVGGSIGNAIREVAGGLPVVLLCIASFTVAICSICLLVAIFAHPCHLEKSLKLTLMMHWLCEITDILWRICILVF